MLTATDIKRIIEAAKEVFATKADFKDLQQNFLALQSAVDAIAKNNHDYHQELKILHYRVDQQGNWIEKASKKVDIPFNQ